MTLDAFASFSHYWDHLLPIWRELPAHHRGMVGSLASSSWAKPFTKPYRYSREDAPIMVAGMVDTLKFPTRPLVYVEHGAGQTYPGDVRSATHGSYSGGDGLERVELFICPSWTVAARWRARYPAARVAVVGCPKLDGLRRNPAAGGAPVVAVAFHWDCPLIPETRSALKHHHPALAPLRDTLAAAGAQLVGHAHPRGERGQRGVWGRLGVPYWRDARQVLRYADVLVCDNSSLMYEFAALGKPVVALNAPWYRRDVNHGMRFWTAIPGWQVDNPADLEERVLSSLERPEELADLRSRVVNEVYAHNDTSASARAAHAVESWLDDA